MKNNIFLVISTLAIIGAVFIASLMFYNSNQESMNTEPKLQRADTTILMRDSRVEMGPTMARVVLVEFLDPECESCRAMHPILKNILKDYEGKLRYIVRYMPYHQNSKLAATWLEATREQNKYWESLDALLESQPQWALHHDPRPDLIPSILEKVGVNIEQAKLKMESSNFEELINQDKEDGMKLGVTGTPSFFVNGRQLNELGDASLRNLIDEELL